MVARIQHRRDTAANWTSVNPTLAEGELGLETDTNRWKMGDGTTVWNSLLYANEVFSGPSSIEANSSTAAFRVTQIGTGEVVRIEDAANPDATPFVVTNAGDVGIGTSSPATKLQVIGTLTADNIDLTTAATATAATSYWVETASDGVIRPKALADVKTELVNTTTVNAAAATTVGTITSGVWQGSAISATYIDSAIARVASPTFTGTVSSEGTVLKMNSDAASGTEDVFFTVERGSDADVSIKWNETDNRWQYTNDGSLFINIGSGAGGGGIVSPTEPTVAGPASEPIPDGYIWVDENDTSAVYPEFPTVIYSPTQPVGLTVGDTGTIWVDQDGGDFILNLDAYQIKTQYVSTSPSAPIVGQMWADSDTNIVYFWNGTSWIEVSSSPLSEFLLMGA